MEFFCCLRCAAVKSVDTTKRILVCGQYDCTAHKIFYLKIILFISYYFCEKSIIFLNYKIFASSVILGLLGTSIVKDIALFSPNIFHVFAVAKLSNFS